jgi:uncharacterized membrane protein YjjP (DUF1212 family)
MILQQHSNLVLALARVLFVNGQSTERTIAATERLARSLGLDAEVLPRWGEVQLQVEHQDDKLLSQVAADPTGVNMQRVAAAMKAIEEIQTGQLAPTTAISAVEKIAKLPPAATWLFTLAAASGAAALAVIFGVGHLAPLALIFLSAAAGALVRRALARRTENIFVQPFCAALLAGVVGGLAVRFELSSSLRLVAVCPCMVLVPGPHFLNSALDLARGRMHLGAARLMYALLVVVAISAGLLLGLALLGTSLPVDPAGKSATLWQDAIAAGVAVFAYSVFFSAPLKILAWPIGVGVLAHALRWLAIAAAGMGVATGALVACFVVSVIITPVARRRDMPFAAVAFASVVSLIPGVYLFRMASGLVQIASGSGTTPELLSATVSDGMTALIILLAMSFGLIVPKMLIEGFFARQERLQAHRQESRSLPTANR